MTGPRSPSRHADDATESIARPPHAPLAVVLSIEGARAHPSALRFAEGKVVIGAGEQSDLVVESPTVSRAHAELTLLAEGVRVRDLGSKNGTFHLGQRVESIVVAPGSRISLGSVELRVEPDPGAFEGEADATEYRGILGVSPAMRRLFAMLSRLEGSLVSVLVLGESGVGKELIARALHEGSTLAEGPFVARNCAAMTRELVQSELFGHKKGAFTGALESRTGAFELAHGGTLFLDEVGELPLDVQPILLRALESGEVVPVGSNEPRRVKVRVVAATNRDVDDMRKGETFREDLFHRLGVVMLRVPPLRERPEDIERLARHFATACQLRELPDRVIAQYKTRPWSGNVRELKNAVEAYAALGSLMDGQVPRVDVIGLALRQLIDLDKPFAEQKEALVDRFTHDYLELVLERARGNQSEAARLSGIERSYLRKLLAKYGLEKPKADD